MVDVHHLKMTVFQSIVLSIVIGVFDKVFSLCIRKEQVQQNQISISAYSDGFTFRSFSFYKLSFFL